MPSFEFDDTGYGGGLPRQITLSSAHARRLGLSDNARDFDVGPSDGFASQDFDLGLDLGDDADETVELGRHVEANLSGARLSLGGRSLNDTFSNAGDLSRRTPGAMDMDVDFNDQQPIDLGLDIGSPRLDNDFGRVGGQYDDQGYVGGGLDFNPDEGGHFDDIPPAMPDLILDGERSRSRECASPPGSKWQCESPKLTSSSGSLAPIDPAR